MAGVGDSWGTAQELLHPRDKHGRFRTKWKMAEGVAKKILAALAAFNPRTFQSDGQAAQYTFNKAKPGRFGGGNGYHRLSADYDAANEALRAGRTRQGDSAVMDASTKKFVDMMDSSAVDLPDDVILSRRVGPEAFGLTPETMGLDEGGLEDFTGKLIADRGYTSANIGTPMGTAPIQISIAVPKGTKAIIPARSRNDRQIYLDRDQEVRITKVDPDGKGGYYVLAVATPRTPGETPTPIGGQGAPGDVGARDAEVERARQLQLQGMKVPDEPAAQHGTPRQRQEQGLAPNPADLQGPVDTGPGGPPPRNEPVHAEAIGSGGAPQAPAAPAAGAPATPGEAPQAPIREMDFKEATKGLPVPSAGQRRLEWNRAYMGIRGGKRDPDDILRELDKDIDVNEHTLAESKARGYDGDPHLEDDIKAQKQLADVIRKHHGIDGKTSDGKAAPTPEPPVPAPAKAAKKSAKKASTPRAPSEQDEADAKLTDKELVAKIGKELEAGRQAKRAQKPVPATEEEKKRPTIGEARRLTALDAARGKPITGEGDAAYKNIVRNLDSGEWTPAMAGREARSAAKYWEGQYREAYPHVGRKDRTPAQRERALELKAISDKYNDLADELNVSQSIVRTDKYRPTAKGIPVKKPGAPAAKKAVPEAPPVKKVAPPKKAVPGAAPGTAAGKITANRLTPGTQILARQDESGAWIPTQRKTGATSIKVTSLDSTTGGRGGRSRRQVTGTDPDGNEVVIKNLSPSQTFIVDQPKVTPVKAAPSKDAELANIRDRLSDPNLSRQEHLDISSRLARLQGTGRSTGAARKPTDDELLAMTKLELIAEAKRQGLPAKPYMNKTELKQLFADESRLSAEDGPATPDSAQAKAALNHADGLDVTVPELKKIAASEGVQVTSKMRKADIQDAIRSKRGTGDAVQAPSVVENPVAHKPIQAPDRKSDFDQAWEAKGLRAPGSAGRSLDEIRGDVSAGRITPDEGIRRLESEIDLNTSEIADIDQALRSDITPQESKSLRAQRADLLKGRNTQVQASEFLRFHFKKAPKATPDEVKVELDDAGRKALDETTPDGLRQAALAQGIKVKGDSKEEILKDLVRQMAGQELERRAAKKVTPAPKAPDKPKPNLEASAHQRIDSRALAEGLDLRTEWDSKMLDRVQAQLDGTDTSLGKNPTPAQIGRNLESWANGPAGPGYKSAVMQTTPNDKRGPEWHAEHDALGAQFKEWVKLADRLKNTRRRRKQDPVPDVTPTVTKDEKKEIAHVAEVTGIPAPQLEARALAKKKAEAPPKQSAVQVAETLKTVGSREEAKTLLQGRTKAELVDIAKATDRLGEPRLRGSSYTKPKLIDAIVEQSVGGRLSFEVLTRGGMRNEKTGHTRADLQDMTIPEIKAIEDDLGIERKSLNRQDRIQAILDAESGTPEPAAPKKAAAPAAIQKPSGRPVRSTTPREVEEEGGRLKNLNRPKADEPVYLPNGGQDQGRMHLDSEMGQLWSELYADDREPNSFVNEIARMGDRMGYGGGDADLERDVIPLLEKLKLRASDTGVEARIQRTIDNLSAPPMAVPDLPEGVPTPIRAALEKLSRIPTARKTGRIGASFPREPILVKKANLVREFMAGKMRPRDFEREFTERDLHESADGAFRMWEAVQNLFQPMIVTGYKRDANNRVVAIEEPNPGYPEIRDWLRSLRGY